MAEQLWKGRFSKAVDSRVNDFNSSIRFDQRMIAQDMRGSGVHAAMLAKQGIISEKDCEDILNGLASIADDLASGKLEIDPNAEDVHTFVEQTLTARIGDAGKRLHTGRSRNDQVALDIRLTLRDYSKMLQGRIVELVQVICKKAAENTTAVMPGYTHLQRAQPITFGHALMAYAWMLLRDLQRFEDATARMDAQCPLGSGALAGTTYPLDRQFTAEKLGFAAPCANSLDGVSDRDFCIELAIGAGFKGRAALAYLKPTAVATVTKLILLPAIFLPMAVHFGFTDQKLVALLVMLGSVTTPAGYVMAKQMGHEGTLTGSVCVTTTFFSALTLTFWVFWARSNGFIV